MCISGSLRISVGGIPDIFYVQKIYRWLKSFKLLASNMS